jgi:hypothetical protein
MDALELLAMQHRDVRALFGRIARSRSPRARRVNTGRLGDLLAVHQATCERHLFPALQACDGEVGEHEGLLDVVEDLTHVDVEDTRFQARVRALRERVEQHASDEERHLFARAREILDGEALERIGQAMVDEADALAQKRPRFDVPRPQPQKSAPPQAIDFVIVPLRFAVRLPGRIYRLVRLIVDGRQE